MKIDYLDKFNLTSFHNIKNGISIDFNFGLGDRTHKILPIIQLATTQAMEFVFLSLLIAH